MTAAAFITGDPRWFKSGLVAISCFIAAERVELMPLGVVVHGLAVLAGYAVMLYSLLVPPVFVLCCAAFGALTIAMMAGGSTLRLAGSFTFIPALYLACESAEGMPAGAMAEVLRTFAPRMAAALIPVLVMSIWAAVQARPAAERPRGYFFWLTRGAAGPRPENLREMMWTVAISVGIAAAAVRLEGLQNGQWAIWSSASVVTGNAATARQKMDTRAFGAVVGVPIGIVLSFLVPHDAYAYGLATLATLLTLDIFKDYRVQFTSTCAMVALAIMLAGDAPGIAAERTVNVVLGGAIGVLTVRVMDVVTALRNRAGEQRRDAAHGR
jgi:hypothetical protein